MSKVSVHVDKFSLKSPKLKVLHSLARAITQGHMFISE